jgi:hypothetical protein
MITYTVLSLLSLLPISTQLNIANGLDDAVTIVCQQFERSVRLVQAESVSDQKIGVDSNRSIEVITS